jgi:hypothetical protein
MHTHTFIQKKMPFWNSVLVIRSVSGDYLARAQTQGGMHLLTHLAVAQLSCPEIDNLISFT